MIDSATIPNAVFQYTWIEFNIDEAVKDWINNDVPNQGLFINITYGQLDFASSEYSDATKRPILEISYTPPAQPKPAITLTKSADKTQAAPGDIITYTIAYQNSGQADAVKVIITDPIPQGTSYEPGSAEFVSGPSGAIDDTTSAIKWTILAVPAGQSGSVSFEVRVE